MPLDEICLEAEIGMEEVVDHLRNRFKAVRTNRASATLVEHIKVDYYDTMTPLNRIANIAIPDPQLIVIRPYDPSALKEIEKALLQSDLGLTPNNDGKLIRLAVPPLSEERRKQLASQVKGMGEECKIAIRNLRRDANKHIDAEEKGANAPEDDADRAKQEIQELTNKFEEQVDALVEHKRQEIMAI